MYAIGFGLPKTVKSLLIANAAVFLVMMLFLPGSLQNLVFRLFGLVPVLVNERFMAWQFVTYMFLHGGFGHLFFNMFALWMFGGELEYNWGSADFLKYYFVCGIGGGLLVWFTAFSFIGLSNPAVPTIGASGAIFGILVAFGMMWPNRLIFLFGILPIKALHFVLIFGALDLLNGLSRSGGGIAYFAHVGGGVTGFIYLKYGWRVMVHLESLVRRYKRRKFTVVDGGKKTGTRDRYPDDDGPLHPDIDEEIDRILDKISREGMDSLTDRERRILERVSSRRK